MNTNRYASLSGFFPLRSAFIVAISYGLLLASTFSYVQAAASGNGTTVQGRVGDTEIHWAAYRGHTGVVERLLKDGAAVDQRVDKGSTPLHLAAYKGHHGVASLLIQYGANVNARNEEGITPLDWARSNNHPEVEKVLLAHNAVVGKPLPGKSQRSRRSGLTGSSPGRYLLSQSGQYREQPLRKVEPQPNKEPQLQLEDDVIERPIRQEELDKLEAVSQINEIMVKHRDKQVERTLPVQAYRIQLAAVGNVDRAQVLLAKYTQRYNSALGQSSLVVEPVKVEGRTLYRLRSNALSQSKANGICLQLHGQGQDCIVVAPPQ